MNSQPGDSFESASGPPDIPVEVGNQVATTAEMEDVKVTVPNQPVKPAKKKEGVKGRRDPPGTATGNAVMARAKVVDVLYVRPPGTVHHRVPQIVPEEDKSPEYYEYRRKNTEAARRCRQKKLLVDQKRVEIIQWQRARIAELEQRKADLQHDNQVYRGVIRSVANQRRRMSQAPQFPPKKNPKK